MELHPLPFFFPPSNDFDDDGGILDELCEYRSALESDVGGHGALLDQLRGNRDLGSAAVVAGSEAESDGAALSLMSPMIAASAAPGLFAGAAGSGGASSPFPSAARSGASDWSSGQPPSGAVLQAGGSPAPVVADPLRGDGAAAAGAPRSAAPVPEWPGRTTVALKRPRQEDAPPGLAADSEAGPPAGLAEPASAPKAAKLPRQADQPQPARSEQQAPTPDAVAGGPTAAEAAAAEARRQAEIALAEETAAAQATLAGLAGANSELKRREWNRLNARKSR